MDGCDDAIFRRDGSRCRHAPHEEGREGGKRQDDQGNGFASLHGAPVSPARAEPPQRKPDRVDEIEQPIDKQAADENGDLHDVKPCRNCPARRGHLQRRDKNQQRVEHDDVRIERIDLGKEVDRAAREQHEACRQDRKRDPLDCRPAQDSRGDIARQRQEKSDQAVTGHVEPVDHGDVGFGVRQLGDEIKRNHRAWRPRLIHGDPQIGRRHLNRQRRIGHREPHVPRPFDPPVAGPHHGDRGDVVEVEYGQLVNVGETPVQHDNVDDAHAEHCRDQRRWRAAQRPRRDLAVLRQGFIVDGRHSDAALVSSMPPAAARRGQVARRCGPGPAGSRRARRRCRRDVASPRHTSARCIRR